MTETYLDYHFQVIDKDLICLQITTDGTQVSLHTLIEEALGMQVTFLNGNRMSQHHVSTVHTLKCQIIHKSIEVIFCNCTLYI